MVKVPLLSLYLPVLSLFFVGLSLWVIILRRRGFRPGTARIDRAIRVQANFAEYAPLFVLLVGFAELQGASPSGLNGLWVMFFVGRGLHAFGLGRHSGKSPARFWGMTLTFTGLVGAAALLLYAGMRG